MDSKFKFRLDTLEKKLMAVEIKHMALAMKVKRLDDISLESYCRVALIESEHKELSRSLSKSFSSLPADDEE